MLPVTVPLPRVAGKRSIRRVLARPQYAGYRMGRRAVGGFGASRSSGPPACREELAGSRVQSVGRATGYCTGRGAQGFAALRGKAPWVRLRRGYKMVNLKLANDDPWEGELAPG